MKLTHEQLQEGRDFVTSKKWDCFQAWMREHQVTIDHDQILRTLKIIMLANDSEKALKMFDIAFVNMDPSAERAAARIFRIGCFVLIGLVVLALGCGVFSFFKIMML